MQAARNKRRIEKNKNFFKQTFAKIITSRYAEAGKSEPRRTIFLGALRTFAVKKIERA